MKYVNHAAITSAGQSLNATVTPTLLSLSYFISDDYITSFLGGFLCQHHVSRLTLAGLNVNGTTQHNLFSISRCFQLTRSYIALRFPAVPAAGKLSMWSPRLVQGERWRSISYILLEWIIQSLSHAAVNHTPKGGLLQCARERSDPRGAGYLSTPADQSRPANHLTPSPSTFHSSALVWRDTRGA